MSSSTSLPQSLSLRALNTLLGGSGSSDANNASDPSQSQDQLKAAALESSLAAPSAAKILKSSVVSPTTPEARDELAEVAPPHPISSSSRSASSENLKDAATKKQNGAISTISSAFKNLKFKRSGDALNARGGSADELAGTGGGSASASTHASHDDLRDDAVKPPPAPLQAAAVAQPAAAAPAPVLPAGLQRTTAAHLAAQLTTSPSSVLVIDTRAPDEYVVCHAVGSFNVFVPPLLTRRWAKNGGSMSASSLSAATGAGGVLGGGAAPRRMSAKSINLEALVLPESERDAFRTRLADAPSVVVLDACDADRAAPGTVVWTIANELVHPGRSVATLEGGWAALAAACPAALLSDPAAAAADAAAAVTSDAPAANGGFGTSSATSTAPGTPGASEDPGSAGPFKRTTSFTLKTTNLRASISRRPQFAAALAVSSAGATGAPGGADSATASPGLASTPASAPSALPAVPMGGGGRRATVGNTARPAPSLLAANQLQEEDESLASPLPRSGSQAQQAQHTFAASPAAAQAPAGETLDEGEQTPLTDDPTTPASLDPSHIIDGLWLGPDLFGHNPEAARATLAAIGVGAVLNMAFECVPPAAADRPAVYKQIATQDSADEKIELVLKEATAFIDEAREQNLTVYVHCKAGKSRSATVVMAYLMIYHGFSFDQAWSHVRTQRPAVAPNIGFFSVLKELGQKPLSAVAAGLATPSTAGSSGSGSAGPAASPGRLSLRMP
ncbi:hypothetical protein H9P43_008275 [Blastocladiella emersonii ATCC 22665]|nr:hypothetical protein H9P43_008275 [Blastocladiella emersonii ATCC 22665]